MNTRFPSPMSNLAGRTLQDLLRVEDDGALLDFRCHETGILIWPMVRTPFLRLVMSDWLYGVPLVGTEVAGQRFQKVASLARASIHNAVKGGGLRGDIALRATGAGQFLQEGKYFNRLSDYFVDACPDRTVVIEDLFNWRWLSPRHNNNVLFNTPILARNAITSKVRVAGAEKQAAQLVGLLRQRAKDLLDWEMEDSRARWYEQLVIRNIARTPGLTCSYESMLARLGAKVLIIEEACYGNMLVCLISAARRLGLATAEYQHGVVSAGHDAYNVASILAECADYRRLLPDYFLGYGRWWNDQINVPVTKLPIGNPHRSETLSGQGVARGPQSNVLVLGDGVETDLYLGLAHQLERLLRRKCRVVFRPHPLERQRVNAAYPKGAMESVVIDRNVDIYQSFNDACAVISEVSTGLFEAVGLAGKIFLWQTPKSRFCFPSHPFQEFSDANELAEMILENGAGLVAAEDVEAIWSSDWRHNYKCFLDRVLKP